MARATGILTKNTNLSYKTSGEEWVALGADLQEFPDLGAAAEQVEVTTLGDANRRYINGIKDFGTLDFTFLYDGASEESAFKKLHALEVAGNPVDFKVELPDGITVTFSGFASVTIAGGAVNDAMTFTLSINLNSDLVIA